MLTDSRNVFTAGLISNFPRGSCHISYHTCNASLHYLCEKHNIKNSKILAYLTQYHRLAK